MATSHTRPASDPDETMARLGAGNFMVMLNRDDYWQCAFVIAKGSADRLKAQQRHDGLRPDILAAGYRGRS